MEQILPVLLGSDANVYGMARSFYMEYGVTSLAIGKGALAATANSKLVKMAVVEPNLEDDAVFVKALQDFAAAQADTLVLVSCGDNYTGLMARNRSALEGLLQVGLPPPPNWWSSWIPRSISPGLQRPTALPTPRPSAAPTRTGKPWRFPSSSLHHQGQQQRGLLELPVSP